MAFSSHCQVYDPHQQVKGGENLYLYYMEESPPCRAVLMVAEFLRLKMNLISIDLTKNEQFSPQFTKLNPFHCLPTLVDGDLVLFESRAIMTYLVDKYYKDHVLYPTNLRERAMIDQFLYFDACQLYKSQSDYLASYLDGKKPESKAKMKFTEKLSTLNQHLDGREYIITHHITLADISILASLSFAEACCFDFSSYPAIDSWLGKVKGQIPCYDKVNKEAMERFTAYMSHLIEKVNDGTDENKEQEKTIC